MVTGAGSLWKRFRANYPFWVVSLSYLLLGVVWIAASDSVVALIALDETMLSFLQTIKGWAFVLVSSALIFVLTRKAFYETKASEEMKRAVFRSTVSASDHILLNYLNQMQLVKIEAEECDDFSSDVLALADRIGKETVEELKRLEELNTGSAKDIDAFIERRLREAREAVGRSV